MAIVAFPLLVAILGLLLWVLAVNPVLKDIGRILFCIGMFFSIATASPEMVRIFR